jgi:sulfur carrier protein ThiS
MKRKVMVTTLVLVGFAVVVIPVLAAEGTVEAGHRLWQRGLGRGPALEQKAELLGMTVEELAQTLASGQNMHDLLEERGIEPPAREPRDEAERMRGSRDFRAGHAARRAAVRHGLMNPSMLAAHADVLGMTAEELQAAIDAGQTMRDILESRGMSPDELHAALAEEYPDLAPGQRRGPCPAWADADEN